MNNETKREKISFVIPCYNSTKTIGSVVREFGRADIRQVLLGDYRIIYRVKRNIPEIISIRHGHFLIRSTRSL